MANDSCKTKENSSEVSKTLSWSDRIRTESVKIESLAYLLENQQGDPDLDILHEGIGLLLHEIGREVREVANEIEDAVRAG